MKSIQNLQTRQNVERNARCGGIFSDARGNANLMINCLALPQFVEVLIRYFRGPFLKKEISYFFAFLFFNISPQ